MIELETMLMQFCLETSGRQNGDRYPVGKGGTLGFGLTSFACLTWVRGRRQQAVRRVILR